MRALVLGGGGITGIAWELGLIAGLLDAGLDLREADVVIGTSAGAVVAAQVCGDPDLDALYTAQLAPPDGERPARLTAWRTVRYTAALLSSRDDAAQRARLGRMASRVTAMPDGTRVTMDRCRPATTAWPRRPRLMITAVDAGSGALQVFDHDSGVDLIEAVAASCAVPMVWPLVRIGGRAYMDGGVRSTANVDLAAGAERVVVLAPTTLELRRRDRPSEQLAGLGRAVQHTLVAPSPSAQDAMGRNALDPALRAASATAGRAQAAEVLAAVRAVWEG